MIRFFIFISLIFITNSSYARNGKISAGLAVGNPTGLSGQYKLNEIEYIQSEFSLNYFTCEYLFKDKYNFNIPEISWYYGLGAVSHKALGGRASTSLQYDFTGTPFHVYSNLSFNLMFNNSSNIGLTLGGRFKF